MGEGQQRSGSGASIIVQEVMEEEWTALQSEDRRLPSLWGPDGMAEVGLPLFLFLSVSSSPSLRILDLFPGLCTCPQVSSVRCMVPPERYLYPLIAPHFQIKTCYFSK